MVKLLQRSTLVIGISIALVLGFSLAASTATEKEPNDTPVQANQIRSASALTGSITPAGDEDYFETHGMGTGWAIVALLDSGGESAVLAALAPDGNTVRAQNSGRWAKGPLIAWLRDTGRDPHFLRVSAKGAVSRYTLRYYSLPLGEKPEREPNDGLKEAITSAITNTGVITSTNDVDCYAFSGKAGQKVMVALNADPKRQGAAADFVVQLLHKDGSVWATADYGGPGEDELIDEHPLPEDGVYGYCIRAKSGFGPRAAYLSGIILNERYYLPPLSLKVVWENPRQDNTAAVGDEMRYTVNFAYESPLPFPEPFSIHLYYDADCQSLVDAGGAETSKGELSWKFDKVTARMTFSKKIVLRAEKLCKGSVDIGYQSSYYVTGTRSHGAGYEIVARQTR